MRIALVAFQSRHNHRHGIACCSVHILARAIILDQGIEIALFVQSCDGYELRRSVAQNRRFFHCCFYILMLLCLGRVDFFVGKTPRYFPRNQFMGCIQRFSSDAPQTRKWCTHLFPNPLPFEPASLTLFPNPLP